MKFILFFILLVEKSLGLKDKECSLLAKEHISYSNIDQIILNRTILIKNFNSFDELNLNCDKKLEILSIIFIPNKEILFDNTFIYEKLFSNLIFKFSKSINFIRIKGFNLKTFGKVNKYFDDITFSFEISKFDFYLNKTKIDENNCKTANFNKTTNFFGAIKKLAIGVDVYYSKKTCPYVFINTRLTQITL